MKIRIDHKIMKNGDCDCRILVAKNHREPEYQVVGGMIVPAKIWDPKNVEVLLLQLENPQFE